MYVRTNVCVYVCTYVCMFVGCKSVYSYECTYSMYIRTYVHIRRLVLRITVSLHTAIEHRNSRLGWFPLGTVYTEGHNTMYMYVCTYVCVHMYKCIVHTYVCMHTTEGLEMYCKIA